MRRPEAAAAADAMPATVREGGGSNRGAALAHQPPAPLPAPPPAAPAPEVQPQAPAAAPQESLAPAGIATPDAERLLAYGSPTPRSATRTFLTLTFGAIALMAVGFAAVAALMHLMR